MSAYPFYKDPRLFELHKGLILHIHSSNFTFALPQLNHSTWNLICGNSGERDRLEFIGDRIISALIAEALYRIRPKENPKFYTNASTVLVANSTFAHIMHKLGYHDITTGIKPAGDAFETVMAAYKQEVGKDTFEEYARVAFEPLIRVVSNTYDDCARSTYYYNYKNQMRVGSKYLLSSRSWKKSKGHPIPRSMLSSGKRKPDMPIIIDLTSDDDDEQVTVTNLSQVSYSKGKLPPGGFSDSAGVGRRKDLLAPFC
ncbi:hypothetical protein BJ165DRAFT_1490681 [Panaeolus papilionaceus]|nr:hypothetical protein BJ165DRAFT_1490681 [Panaeolus papilionaceus]